MAEWQKSMNLWSGGWLVDPLAKPTRDLSQILCPTVPPLAKLANSSPAALCQCLEAALPQLDPTSSWTAAQHLPDLPTGPPWLSLHQWLCHHASPDPDQRISPPPASLPARPASTKVQGGLGENRAPRSPQLFRTTQRQTTRWSPSVPRRPKQSRNPRRACLGRWDFWAGLLLSKHMCNWTIPGNVHMACHQCGHLALVVREENKIKGTASGDEIGLHLLPYGWYGWIVAHSAQDNTFILGRKFAKCPRWGTESPATETPWRTEQSQLLQPARHLTQRCCWPGFWSHNCGGSKRIQMSRSVGMDEENNHYDYDRKDISCIPSLVLACQA